MQEWEQLIKDCRECKKCNLYKNRSNMVFGEGNTTAKAVFIGEAPGADEDASGRPFVGKAGQLLNLALKALRMKREDYYIANICKCRPENNRVPTEDEAQACMTHLKKQIELIKPGIIVCMGATPLKYLVDRNAQISKIRGNWIVRGEYSIMPTYHPAALLRDPGKKIDFWEDLKEVRNRLKQ